MIDTNKSQEGQPPLPMQGIPQPTRDEVLKLPRVHISSHPVMAHKMTALRDNNTTPPDFYRLVKEIGALLAYEATENLALDTSTIETPLQATTGYRLAGGIGVTPILRAGLGLAEGFREVISDAQVWHLGLRRDERTLRALEYYNRLPHQIDLQVCYAVDPMLATGGSAIDALNILKRRNIPRLCYVGIIAAPYGLLKLTQAHPDVDIYIAALDESLNDYGYIVPGLGDAGDRQFGTF
ncbi:uracil phosphoribosyltransferase [Reticulibacter mediterranei]|uniref:Uracil phosphoribosyltransferase n=1 Tax=Reticulibacter mediterranei TaxID=2778369 RepID=A0A8J3MYS8_9CHLR|nr:uracil phosphoribosyltransferase [Reticulibacter mediterranei]GHO92394.1 uracil phosphoribosyltransferase [Reticulibacter mediterranei]